jgi:hypothetical protein
VNITKTSVTIIDSRQASAPRDTEVSLLLCLFLEEGGEVNIIGERLCLLMHRRHSYSNVLLLYGGLAEQKLVFFHSHPWKLQME